jgi:hypothetical protein
MRMDKQTNEKLKFLATKYGKDIDELKTQIGEMADGIKEEYPDRGNATCLALARRQLVLNLRTTRRGRGAAKSGTQFQGYIFGLDRLRDRQRTYNEAYDRMESKLSQPNKTVTDKMSGLICMVDEDGRRIDMRKQIKGRDNFNYGKPMGDHDWHRVIFGVAATSDGAPNWFVCHVYGDIAAELNSSLTFTPVSFNANARENLGDNGEQFLTLKSMPAHDTTVPVTLDQVLQFSRGLDLGSHSRYIELGDITDFIDEHWDEQWSTTEFLVEADVDGIWPSDGGGGRIYLIDESLEFLDEEFDSIMGWFRDDAKLNFAEGSRLVIACNAFRKKGWDRELQMETDEWGDPQINIIGWYALPDFHVPPLDAPNVGPLEDEEE